MTQTMQKRDFTNLASLLAEQRDAYALLLSMSRGQEKVFRNGGARSLMKLVGRKQAVIEGLASIDKSLAPYTVDWNATLGALPAPARREVAALVTEIGESLRALVESEHAIADVVAQARDETAGKIRGIGRRRAAVSAYGRKALAGAGRLLDREG